MEELSGPYYFRLTAKDEPGVLAGISGVLGKHKISIESVIQKGRKQNGSVALVIVTHSAMESAVRAAIDEIDGLDIVTAPTVKIRILEDE